MLASQIDFVPLGPDHLDAVVSLTRDAGWPHRPEDWALVLDLGVATAAVAEGRVVGSIFLAQFGSDTATISGVIVDAALRGRGVGRRLLEWALQAAGERECRLVATEDGLPLYRSLGFVEVATIQQHQGVLERLPPAGDDWVGPAEEAACAALDRAAYGADRSRLIAALFRQGRVAALRDGGGFGVLRRFGRGEVAGPVVAGSIAEARSLLGRLFDASAGGLVRVDTAEPALAAWLTEMGLVCVGTGVEMRRGARERTPARHRSFALASQALG